MQPLLMDRATFDAHAHAAVTEPSLVPAPGPGALPGAEEALDAHLRTLDKGRLEQEFLSAAAITAVLQGWAERP